MTDLARRRFLAAAAALGATAVWGRGFAAPSRIAWRERRDVFREGVASGDPGADSAMLWTRYSAAPAHPVPLTVEVAEDPDFQRIIATARTRVAAEADWTCRVLVGGLKPASEYWYRFTDEAGNGSRIGRTVTAPSPADPRRVQFAFVSCQNANGGAQTAYRRMLHDDRHAAPEDRLGFVLHLGDFIYELVWYPEDRPQGMYDRKIRDLVRYPHGEKVDDFHIPTTLDDYRAVYRAYLADPDLQDARAYLPFVPMWDNHEFSWLGWQSVQQFDGKNLPRPTRKIAAMQAWFEYQPARVKQPSGSLARFDPPRVVDAPIERFDDHGLGQEPNNLAAIASLTGYRALRWGRHVDLIITDQRSYRSQAPEDHPEADAFGHPEFPQMMAEDIRELLDGGRTANAGKPPATIHWADKEIANVWRDKPAQTILGQAQKAWFLERLKASTATWKIWGNTTGTLDSRADPQNLPAGTSGLPHWPGTGYANLDGGDHGSAYVERGEIYDFVTRHAITGFATVAGDRHSFWAGFAAKALPPKRFEPVGIAFITGSISAPGLVEAYEHKLPKTLALRALFLADRPGRAPEPTVNMLLRHGVRSCLEYAASGDIAKARALSNPDNAPHLRFVDMAGHGYTVVRAAADAFETEFVCIQRPVGPTDAPDGGPVRYRVVHRAATWKAGEPPVLTQRVIEGDPKLSI